MLSRSLLLAPSLLLSSLLLALCAQGRWGPAEIEMMSYLQKNEPLNLEQLKEAVSKGLDPKAPLPQQWTHLHGAARAGDVASILYLLQLGCDINARDALGNTPLIYAVQCQKLDVVMLLLDKGADAHLLGHEKQPLIFFACMNPHTEVLAFLLNKGHRLSDIKPCFYYADAFELACDSRNLKGSLYLAERGEVKDKDAALFPCVSYQSDDMLPLMEWLLQHGASPNAKCAQSGQTILHLVAAAQCPKMVELLLKHGAKWEGE